MFRNRQTILYATFISLMVEVVNSHSRNMIGAKGKIVDETKNLIVIENKVGQEKKLQKRSCTFRFYLGDKSTFDIDGKEIMFRPEDRAKKV
ncbi:MAG: ribonuclease P protein subunit [Candidatus Micrarchaeota archaeon]|nr:ribonuclease P protein subunit [Candidatus Micrarchaeota archaeon]